MGKATHGEGVTGLSPTSGVVDQRGAQTPTKGVAGKCEILSGARNISIGVPTLLYISHDVMCMCAITCICA